MIDMPIVELAAGAVGAILAALAVLYFARKQADRKIAQARIDFDEEIDHIQTISKGELDRKLKEAEVAQKTELLRQHEDIERQNKTRTDEMQRGERRLIQREEMLDKRGASLDAGPPGWAGGEGQRARGARSRGLDQIGLPLARWHSASTAAGRVAAAQRRSRQPTTDREGIARRHGCSR